MSTRKQAHEKGLQQDQTRADAQGGGRGITLESAHIAFAAKTEARAQAQDGVIKDAQELLSSSGFIKRPHVYQELGSLVDRWLAGCLPLQPVELQEQIGRRGMIRTSRWLKGK